MRCNTDMCRESVWSVIGAETTKCPDHGAALQDVLSYPVPGPSALGGEAQLALEAQLGLWHSCLAWKQHFQGSVRQSCGARWAQAFQGDWDFRHSTSGKATQQGWTVIPAASAAHGCSITRPGTPNCWQESIAYMGMTVSLGDEPRYPGFCGIKWGHMTLGMWDTHVLVREALRARQEPLEAHVLATKLCLVYLDIDFKHY